ncbi:two-component system response regulator [Dictyobacter sp. S3.2.2.5]|uniref:Two-component system response regulator n=1 Tax=Dictyobacter halimunensis TaxID=3026934 RepID=A0ABQ6G2Z8_9CHLR|nr:two-component system response regulator [Dictyobacter sp. S3.2.2.5]
MAIAHESPLLFIEDNDDDYEVVLWAMKKLSLSIPITRCIDGDEALDYLYHRQEFAQPGTSPRPALILLDLNLISVDGRDVLQAVKSDPELRMIPVIIWTSSEDPKDIDVSFQLGANSYILKPMNMKQLLGVVETLNKYWFGVAVAPAGDTLVPLDEKSGA